MLTAAVYLPTSGGRAVIDYDEGHYSQVALRMAESGDWVTPYANGVRFLEKPLVRLDNPDLVARAREARDVVEQLEAEGAASLAEVEQARPGRSREEAAVGRGTSPGARAGRGRGAAAARARARAGAGPRRPRGVPHRPGDFAGKDVSGDKACRELGWTPRVEFEEGLRETVEWFRAKWGA